MEDRDIIKALEHDAISEFDHWVIDLINRQKADIESSRKHTELWAKKFYEKKAKLEALQMDKEQLESDVINANMNCEHIKNIWESDYQKLSEVITKWKDQYKRLVIQEEDIRAEAVKEFAERFENELTKIEEIYFDEEHENFISANKVIALLVNLVKEMVGATDG